MKTVLFSLVLGLFSGWAFCVTEPDPGSNGGFAKEPGLLFYLSGDHGFEADYAAGGQRAPNFLKDVKILPGGANHPSEPGPLAGDPGAKGSYLQCGNDQLLSYWAPGNIYSQRGTLSFFWRSRDAVDATEFPVFRVGYGDHSSWDMVWLRIDYNGHGFDAFVTDVNLGRTRVSYSMPNFPKPDEWVHLALAWDETRGIRFYVNGKLAGEKAATGMFDAALDQFGPHSRIIAPTGVESSYNYDRGGDIDELRIYDRMLSDENIVALAKNEVPLKQIPRVERSVAEKSWRDEWGYRYGWNRPGDVPTPLPAGATTVRKVEIHDAYDLKRWWWKGTDGIRETTWPGVYNRSRLVGRFDYFQLPDWDCYSLSGKSVTFYMPNEPWNHLEIEGGAWGNISLLTPGDGKDGAVADPDQHDTSPMLAKTLFERPKGQERTTHDLAAPVVGEKVRFTNVEQEWPIGEFSAYYVHPGKEPEGAVVLHYSLNGRIAADNPSLTELVKYIDGRFPADERATMVAMPGVMLGGGRTAIPVRERTQVPAQGGAHGGEATAGPSTTALRASGRDDTSLEMEGRSLPIVHVLVPADFRGVQADVGHGTSYGWENMHAGLDGIAIDLPALKVKPTHGQYATPASKLAGDTEYVPMNIQIKDPIWPMRNMLNFNFSVKPGEAHTLWLDTRDRILPNGKSLWITIASVSEEFGPEALEGARLRLVFKPWRDAVAEHVSDRLTQVRDNYANLVEESVNSRKLNIFNRFDADITDLLRVDPENVLGRKYWNEMNHEQLKPPFAAPVVPQGVPAWAYLQVQDLGYLKRLINWYIDNRQISNGEFGGGLSDDSDFLNWWPGLAAMGADPDKLKASLLKTLDTMYDQHMFTNGLATAQYDELHSYEDGINVLGQSMLIDYGSPKQLERAMETAKRLEWLTGLNVAGQRQIRSSYYSGTKMAENGVWGWAKSRSYMVFHPALMLVLYNGTPETRKMVLDVADGFLAHRHKDANGKYAMHYAVNFHTNEDLPGGQEPWFVLWAAYRWTGDKKYLAPFEDDPRWALRTINADALDFMGVRDTWGKELLGQKAPDRWTDAGNANETTMHLDWQLTGDTKYLEKLYLSQIETAVNREFINTEGSLWIDRVYFNNGELQRARLGGVPLMRNYVYPGNAVSWRFRAPANDQSVAILVPEASPDHLKVIAYNLESSPVTARMTGWEVDPGEWEIRQGVQGGEGESLRDVSMRTERFERSRDIAVTFAPHATTVLELKLVKKGVPYWSRPDLGIDPEDVKVNGRQVQVTVHSLGAVDAPASRVVVRDSTGNVVGSASVPAMKAPVDLVPKRATVMVNVAAGAELKGGSVAVESSGKVLEITEKNNRVEF